MEIVTIPCLQDNFAYLLICPKTGEAAVVDPSEADPVRKEIKRQNVKLTAILNTHHHWDHVGGNKELKADCPYLKIYGHASDRGRIPEQTEYLEDGDKVLFGEQSGSFLHNPGHTSGAITYLFEIPLLQETLCSQQAADGFLKGRRNKCMIHLTTLLVSFRTGQIYISDMNILKTISVLP